LDDLINDAPVRNDSLYRRSECKIFHGKIFPSFLGFDEQGREVLSFIAGEVSNDPLWPSMWSDENVWRAASPLRRYHDAAAL